MEPNSFFPSEFTNYEYIYNNENNIAQLQVPLSISYFNVPQFANELYTDTDTTYFTYSGDWSSLIVSREKDGRYKNLSMRAYSGDSFKFYFSTGLGFSSGADYYSGPVTISGSYSKLTAYSGEAAAITNAITFLAPSGNSAVFTLPFVENINWIRLHHKEAVSGESYRLYQFLPRTLIQVDDLEADVIDAVTVRVSGSIVVSADDLAPGSITGDKIMAGTVSGVLITPSGITATQIAAGTITATQIAVSGITANRLNVSQLDAVAANMGTLIVNSGITVGTNGYIWTGTGSAATPTTGLKIYTTSGVSRLTTYASGVAQVDIASNGKLLAGGGAVILDSAGMTAGKTVVNSNGITIGDLTSLLNNNDALKIMVSGTSGNNGGISFYNGAYSSISPQSAVTTDATNNFVIANNVPDGNLIIQNANTGANSIYLYNSEVQIMRTVSGTVPAILGFERNAISEFIPRYTLGQDGLYLFNTNDDFVNNPAPNLILERTTGNITTDGDIAVSGNIHAGLGDHMFTVNGTTGNLHVGAPPHVFTVNGSSGNTNISGNLNAAGAIGFGTSNNKVTIAAATGNTAIAGTLGVTSTLTASANVLQYNYGGLYKNTAQNVAAGADAKITFQVSYTNGTLDSIANSRLTTAYAGFYVISAGVISSKIGDTWQVVTGGAFGTGQVMNGIVQADMRSYVTKLVYLNAGTNLELYVRNGGGSTMAVSTGATGTVLSAAKVG